MKMPARVAVWLLPFVLAGCNHKNISQVQPLAPPIEDTPPPKPAPPTDLPPPVVTVPAKPADTDANTQPPPPKPPAKHRKPAPKPADQTPAKTTEQASTESPGVSAIGQLSTGAPNDLRRATSDSIAATERGLNAITRPLSDQEQKTAAQIREFLKQAKDALTTGDVDGAHTLAAKAKVLLGELQGH